MIPESTELRRLMPDPGLEKIRSSNESIVTTVHPTALADFAVRHTRTGRDVGGVKDRAKDVLSPNCHRQYGVRVESYYAASSSHGTDGWRQAAISDRKIPVPDLAAFRIDLARWLRTLCHRDRRIIAALVAGQNGTFVADKFGISTGRISQLRRRYEQLWTVFHDETPCTPEAIRAEEGSHAG